MLIVVCAVLFSTPMPNPTNKHKQNKTNTTYIHIHMHKHNHTTHTCIRIYNHIHIDSRLFTFYTHTCNTTHDRLQQQAIQITTIMTIFIQSRTTHNHRIHSCHHHSIFSLSLLSLLSLLLLLSSSSSSFLLVSGGRIISYTDTECIQSDPAASIEAQFIPGTCYTAGQGSVIVRNKKTTLNKTKHKDTISISKHIHALSLYLLTYYSLFFFCLFVRLNVIPLTHPFLLSLGNTPPPIPRVLM